MKNTIYAVVRIEYDFTLNCTAMEEKDCAAIDLAINPNFHTVENGVSLKSVHLSQVVPHSIIDWYALEHNPEQVYVEQY